MCVVCRGYKTHEEELEKGDVCTLHRFSADGARTRATLVIRWRVLGVRALKVETEKRGTGPPGDSRTHGKGCVCVGVRGVSGGRDPRAVSRSPTAKAEVRGAERKREKRQEDSRMGHKGAVCKIVENGLRENEEAVAQVEC